LKEQRQALLVLAKVLKVTDGHKRTTKPKRFYKLKVFGLVRP